MFQYLRKAVAGNNVKDLRNSLIQDEYRKKKLKENLARQIKKLQKSHVNDDVCIVERNDEDALQVCMALEAIFLHEYQQHASALAVTNLRSMFVDGVRTTDDDIVSIAFWDMLKEVTHHDVITQLKHLVVTTEIGLCRAWIRLALNDCLIVSYLDAILADRNQLKKYYGVNAFLMDSELPDILKEYLQGLMQFEFRLNYNSSKLNMWDTLPLQLAGILPEDNKLECAQSEGNTARLKDVAVKNDILGPVSTHSDIQQTGINTSAIQDTQTPYENKTPLATASSDKIQLNENPPVEGIQSSIDTTVSRKIFKVESDTLMKKVSSEHAENAEEKESSPSTHDVDAENMSQNSVVKNDVHEAPPVLIGNRLGGNGWSGWSSSFERESSVDVNSEEKQDLGEKSVEESTDKEEIADMNKKNESFGTLLKVYGVNNPSKDTEVLNPSSDEVDADVVIQPKENTVTDAPEKEDCTSPAQSDANLAQMNFEVVPMSYSLQKHHIDEKTQSSLNQLTLIGLEQGLDKQNFRCKQCGKPIGLIYGPYRVCYYDGGYYCFDCHDDEEHVIPSRVIQNWDFKRHKVSKYNKLFLMKIEEEPLFHIDEINAGLYDVIIELKEVKLLRLQLLYIKEYVQTCRNEVTEDFRIRLWPREYLCDDIHQYSLLDLVQVYNGQLAHHLKKVIVQFSKHIYKCTLCRQKGFICEYCHDPAIIYPFQVNIAAQCPGCLSTFHIKCRRDKRCPKCVRIHLRSQSNKNEMDRRLSVTQKEQLGSSDIL